MARGGNDGDGPTEEEYEEEEKEDDDGRWIWVGAELRGLPFSRMMAESRQKTELAFLYFRRQFVLKIGKIDV